MALIHMDIVSQSLKRSIQINVILPSDKGDDNFQLINTPDTRFKTLYLLHGIWGNNMDWIKNTNIQRYAEENNIAVVFPSGENSFYVDHPESAGNYGMLIGEEIVDLTRRSFPLSNKREDTFIGGLSMGGYGALRNGLKYSDTFGAIVALSSALITDETNRTNDSDYIFFTRRYFEYCFGPSENVKESDCNPKKLVMDILNAGKPMPRIYLACGTEDFLFDKNNDFADFLKENNVKCTYETGPGAHEWDFWDTYIKKGISWLLS